MLIQEEVYEKCGECGSYKSTVKERLYGCNHCRKEIQRNLVNGHRSYLDVTVFRNPNDSDSEQLEFCSWKCLLEFLPTIECDYFITLPYLTFDDASAGISGKDFLELLKART